MSTEGSGATRGGGSEFHNEDAFLAKEGLGLYIVSDGASERPAGEVAASIATRALEEFIGSAMLDAEEQDRPDDHTLVGRAMQHAIHAIRDANQRAPDALDQMQASVTMLLTDGHHGTIGHRGDSRVYLIRHGRLVRLTIDGEPSIETSPERADGEIEVFSVGLKPGDTLVLCTDGAEDAVEDPAIVRVAGELSPRVLASRIVSAASRRMPDRDATAVAVRVRGGGRGADRLELSEPVRETAFGHTLAPIDRGRTRSGS